MSKTLPQKILLALYNGEVSVFKLNCNKVEIEVADFRDDNHSSIPDEFKGLKEEKVL